MFNLAIYNKCTGIRAAAKAQLLMPCCPVQLYFMYSMNTISYNDDDDEIISTHAYTSEEYFLLHITQKLML